MLQHMGADGMEKLKDALEKKASKTYKNEWYYQLLPASDVKVEITVDSVRGF